MKTDIPTTRPPARHISKIVSHEALMPTDTCIPVTTMSRAEAASLGLDARALFIFGFIDDRRCVLELITTSGLPLSDAAEALVGLCDAGAVALVPTPR